jgi:mRNA-degrading endonuclease toxin of MazEF toxin-antitoxin module
VPPRIRQAEIYWLDDCDPLDGDETKDRPVIVLSTGEMLRTQNFALVVACSTHPREQDQPRFHIPSRRQVPDTGLPVDCWALPRWYIRINPYRLTVTKGTCPEALFVRILSATLAQMDADEANG